MSRGAALAMALGTAAALAAGAALAHDDPMPKNPTPAQKAAWTRHEHFEQLGKTFKGMVDELKKDSPDKAMLASSAKTIDGLAGGLPTWFPRGSGVEARPMSQAKADVWSDAAGFSAAAAKLREEAARMNTAAASGDLGAIKGQVRNLGGACKGCHDKYRQEKKT
jgi:cytochrome c556